MIIRCLLHSGTREPPRTACTVCTVPALHTHARMYCLHCTHTSVQPRETSQYLEEREKKALELTHRLTLAPPLTDYSMVREGKSAAGAVNIAVNEGNDFITSDQVKE